MFGGIGTYWGPLIGAAHPDPVVRNVAGRAGRASSPASRAWSTARRSSLIMLLAPEGLFWFLRDPPGPARWRHGAGPGCDPRCGRPRPGRTARRPSRRPPWHRARPWTAGAGALLEVTRAGQELRWPARRVGRRELQRWRPGTILGIIGPNGAGKTTLFNVLNGVLSGRSCGEALLDGKPLVGRKLHEVCRMGVGRTFQVVRSLPPPAAAGQRAGRRLWRRASGPARRMAACRGGTAMDRTGLSHLANRPGRRA